MFSEEAVSILTGPEGPVLPAERRQGGDHRPPVSILTGPEGPVLPGAIPPTSAEELMFQSSPAPKGRCCGEAHTNLNATEPVSILTGPEGPVLQRGWAAVIVAKGLFQSSPAPKGRCCLAEVLRWEGGYVFQSSPAPKGRCCAAGDPR